MSTGTATPRRLHKRATAMLHEVRERIGQRSRWWRIGVAAALVVVLWSIPWVIAHSPLRNSILRSLATDLQGTLECSGASLGWFSSVVLYDVELADDNGQAVLTADEVQVGRSLLSLLRDGANLGTVRLVRPRVDVAMSATGSNIEDLLAKWSQQETSSPLAAPAVKLEIVEGVLHIADLDANSAWTIDDISATVALPSDWSGPLEATLQAAVPVGAGKSPISMNLSVDRRLVGKGQVESGGQAEVQTESFPLELVELLARRSWPEVRLAGRLAANARVAWNAPADAPGSGELEGEISGIDCTLAAPQLGKDLVRLSKVTAPGRLVWNGTRVTVERLGLDCEVGRASLTGPVTLDLALPLAQELPAALLRDAYQAQGEVDLARLAAVLPDTLRLREGTRITAGHVKADLARQNGPQGATWKGTAEVGDLAAENRGRALAWKQPIRATLDARDGADGPVIEQFNCKSEFLDIEAAGAIDSLTASSVYSLEKLAAQLDQFIDLGDWRLAGDGWSYLSWNRGPAQEFQLEGEFQVRDLELGSAAGGRWAEENLVALISLSGESELRSIRRLNAGKLTLHSGGDTAEVALRQAVPQWAPETPLPLSVRAQGQMAAWMSRLAAWYGPLPGDWNVAGEAALDGNLLVSSQRVELAPLTLSVRRLLATGNGLRIAEPEVRAQVAAAWDRAAGTLVLTQADVDAVAATFRGRNISYATAGGGADLSGSLEYSAQLAALQQWTLLPEQTPARQLVGTLRGAIDINRTQLESLARLEANIDDFKILEAGQEVFREPRVELAMQGRYDPATDTLTLPRLVLDADTMRCDARGQAVPKQGQRELEVTGTCEYDTPRLLELLRPWLGGGVAITAQRRARPFVVVMNLGAVAASAIATQPVTTARTIAPPEVRARLAARTPSSTVALGGLGGLALPTAVDSAAAPLFTDFYAEGGAGWTGAAIHGFRLGTAEFQGVFDNGLLAIDPFDITASDGRLTAAPRLQFWPAPAALQLGAGPLLTQVRISREMCATGLKYVAPVLADVGQAEGTFSIALDGCQLPLAAPETGDLSGRMTVHAVQVEAGPLLRQIVFVADTFRRVATNKNLRPAGAGLSPVSISRESVVTFRMVEGRVYHKDLVLVFDDVSVRTYGSVGLDQSLALMAELPIPDKWLGTGLGTSALRGQTLQVPIGGTLQEPRIDQQAFQDAAARFVQKGAQGALLDGLKGQLERLFPPAE